MSPAFDTLRAQHGSDRALAEALFAQVEQMGLEIAHLEGVIGLDNLIRKRNTRRLPPAYKRG